MFLNSRVGLRDSRKIAGAIICTMVTPGTNSTIAHDTLQYLFINCTGSIVRTAPSSASAAANSNITCYTSISSSSISQIVTFTSVIFIRIAIFCRRCCHQCRPSVFTRQHRLIIGLTFRYHHHCYLKPTTSTDMLTTELSL